MQATNQKKIAYFLTPDTKEHIKQFQTAYFNTTGVKCNMSEAAALIIKLGSESAVGKIKSIDIQNLVDSM